MFLAHHKWRAEHQAYRNFIEVYNALPRVWKEAKWRNYIINYGHSYITMPDKPSTLMLQNKIINC